MDVPLLRSSNGTTFNLLPPLPAQQETGNLTLTDSTNAMLWQTGTGGSLPPYVLTMQVQAVMELRCELEHPPESSHPPSLLSLLPLLPPFCHSLQSFFGLS